MAAPLSRLSPTQCLEPTKAGYAGSLDENWKAYAPYVRACPLAGPGTVPAKVWLLTIFAQRYQGDHSAKDTWPDFPHPMLIAADGHCLARLPELFPFDPPRTLDLQFGDVTDGVPQVIRVHVSNPAVGGDYDLPALRWNAATHAYVAQNDTDIYKKADLSCKR